MNDLFLKVDEVSTREQALESSISTALGRNKVYRDEEHYERREEFRAKWAKLLATEAEAYKKPTQPISDEEHCEAIARIADTLSAEFGEILAGGRLRFGTSQKAFNLFLKYLWFLKEAERPPHCPIDRVVLAKVGIEDCWTKSDDPGEYMGWINEIRKHLNLAEWENEVWLRWRIANFEL